MTELTDFQNFAEFKRSTEVSAKTLCREIWLAGGAGSRVKNEATAVANLEKIVRATLKLANRKGFAATSLRDLSAETGLSMGGLYAYIGGKDELAELIQLHGRALNSSVLHSQMDAFETSADKLRAALRAHLFLSEIIQAWFFFCFMEARHLAKPQKKAAIESEQETEQLFLTVLEQGVASGEFGGELGQVDASLSASMIKALLQDWYLKRGKYRRRKITIEAYADQVWAMVARHLGLTV